MHRLLAGFARSLAPIARLAALTPPVESQRYASRGLAPSSCAICRHDYDCGTGSLLDPLRFGRREAIDHRRSSGRVYGASLGVAVGPLTPAHLQSPQAIV